MFEVLYLFKYWRIWWIVEKQKLFDIEDQKNIYDIILSYIINIMKKKQLTKAQIIKLAYQLSKLLIKPKSQQ